jgi:hypothetical protein
MWYSSFLHYYTDFLTNFSSPSWASKIENPGENSEVTSQYRWYNFRSHVKQRKSVRIWKEKQSPWSLRPLGLGRPIAQAYHWTWDWVFFFFFFNQLPHFIMASLNLTHSLGCLWLSQRGLQTNAARQHCFLSIWAWLQPGPSPWPLTCSAKKLTLFLPPANSLQYCWIECILSILWTLVFGIKVIFVFCTWNHIVMRQIILSYSQWGGKMHTKQKLLLKWPC